MTQVVDRLLALRVADVMAKNVVTVDENQTMSEAARLLAEQQVSSVPVVDDCGHCVGIITLTDFVRRKSDDNLGAEPHLSVSAAGELRADPGGEDYVSAHMSRGVQGITPGASLLTAARVMCAEHIHHLLAIDEKNHPIGVVSTMDIVAAVVNVVDEMNVGKNLGEM